MVLVGAIPVHLGTNQQKVFSFLDLHGRREDLGACADLQGLLGEFLVAKFEFDFSSTCLFQPFLGKVKGEGLGYCQILTLCAIPEKVADRQGDHEQKKECYQNFDQEPTTSFPPEAFHGATSPGRLRKGKASVRIMPPRLRPMETVNKGSSIPVRALAASSQRRL